MEYIRRDKTKSDEMINDHIILIHYEVYNDGGCQCSKDCDCAKNKGVKSKFSNYKHSLSRCTFSTIKQCKDDYTLTLDNQRKRATQIIEAKEWFNSLSLKEQNSMINLYKQHPNNYNSYKKHSYKSIKQNASILKDIHRSLIKWELI